MSRRCHLTKMLGIKDWVITVTTLLVFLFGLVKSQCSDAHRDLCSWSHIRLQLINSRTTSSTQYIPDFNATTLRYACDLYQEYSNCSQPFLSSCNTETLDEFNTYENSLGPVCGDLLESYIENKGCYDRLQQPYSTCQSKKVRSMRIVDKGSPAYKYILCSSYNDYVMCTYTATALGCSMQAADVYFEILSKSIRTIFKADGYHCVIRHPLDVISIYTTASPSTVDTRTSPSTDSTRDSPMMSRDTSGCSKHVSMQLLHLQVCSLLNLIYFSVT